LKARERFTPPKLRPATALRALLSSDRTIAYIASEVGYDSEFSFSRAFKRHLGAAPSTYRAAAVLR
jgi:AraC-like DNA-binding protein